MAGDTRSSVVPTPSSPVFMLLGPDGSFPDKAKVLTLSCDAIEFDLPDAEKRLSKGTSLKGIEVLLPLGRRCTVDGEVKNVSGTRCLLLLLGLSAPARTVLEEYMQLRLQIEELHRKTYKKIPEVEASVYAKKRLEEIAKGPEDTRKKVLIVDDSSAVHDRFRGVFQDNGFEVLQAVDGITAIKLALEAQPHIILMDLNMPKMNGIESARVIRSNPATSKIPICMFTTEGEKDAVVKALSIGVKDYIIKTMPPEDVLGRVKKILNIP